MSHISGARHVSVVCVYDLHVMYVTVLQLLRDAVALCMPLC